MRNKLIAVATVAGSFLGLVSAAHAQSVDAAFVNNVATTSIASVVTIWSGILPIILPFAIAVAVLFAVIHFIRRRSRPN